MPICFKRDDGRLQCCVWRVTETVEELSTLVPHGALLLEAAFQRYTSPKRRMEFVAVHVLLATVLQAEVWVEHHPSGRPYLRGNPHCQVSVSHTRGYVAVALSRSGCPGVDIEHYASKADRLRGRIVSPDERADNTWDILLHWSAKETAFKMMDCQGVDFLKHLRAEGVQTGAVAPSEPPPFRLFVTHPACRCIYTIRALLFEDAVLTYAID